MRALSMNEMEEVNGGIAPLVAAALWAGARYVGGAAVSGFAGAAGGWAFASMSNKRGFTCHR